MCSFRSSTTLQRQHSPHEVQQAANRRPCVLLRRLAAFYDVRLYMGAPRWLSHKSGAADERIPCMPYNRSLRQVYFVMENWSAGYNSVEFARLTTRIDVFGAQIG